jgi:hypothetical protein
MEWAISLVVAAILAPTWLGWWNTHLNKKELKTNGGSSLKDKVDAIHVWAHALHEKVTSNDGRLDAMEEKMDEHIEAMRVAHLPRKRATDPPDFNPEEMS